jgi:hypothetical protein
MSSFKGFFAFVLALFLLGIASPVLAQIGDTTLLGPDSGSTLVQQDPPPPDDGDKNFDELDSDVLNLTSPSISPPSSPRESSPAPSPQPLWTTAGWVEALRDWLGVETP